MKSYQQYITELFEKPYPLTVDKKLGHGIALFAMIYKAQVKDDKTLRIEIAKIASDGWQIDFDINKSYELTNDGEALRILATVIESIKAFLKEYASGWEGELPENLYFVAEKSEDSRQRVYTHLLNRFGKEHGYTISKAKSGDDAKGERHVLVATRKKD